ncbi:hypothetical protein CR513_36561, partial [Mucuna pruriens]
MEVAKYKFHDECLEKQRRQGLVEIIEERRKTVDWGSQADTMVWRLKEQASEQLEMVARVEEAARNAQEDARFWKDRKAKQSTHQHKYTTRLKSKAMESKVEALEQQNQDLRGEVGQLWEQMAQMFQILTQSNVVVMALVNTNVAEYTQNGYACNGWNTENAAKEEQKQQNTRNNGLVFNASSGASPNPKEDSGAQHQTSGNPPPFVSLEERLYAIEGGDKYGLEVIDLCLVLDVGLPAECDNYKGSSYPYVHLAMYCRKMAAYIYDDKDNLTGATLSCEDASRLGEILQKPSLRSINITKTWRLTDLGSRT